MLVGLEVPFCFVSLAVIGLIICFETCLVWQLASQLRKPMYLNPYGILRVGN